MNDSKPAPSRADSTRQQLLDAAAAVFADHYFDGARVTEIAARAGQPVSAINYHFGGKLGLYQAMLEQQLAHHLSHWPLIPPGAEALPPPERLRAMIHALLHRFCAPGAPIPLTRIVAREFAQPTAALNTLIEQVARPQLTQLAKVIGELTGERRETRLKRLVLSVVGQCAFYFFARPVVSQLAPGAYADEQSLEQTADHIADFSLAALRALAASNDQPLATEQRIDPCVPR